MVDVTPKSSTSAARTAGCVQRKWTRQALDRHVQSLSAGGLLMIRKLKSGEYRLYSQKKNPRTGRRRNLGTFGSRAAAEKHERAVQFFKRH